MKIEMGLTSGSHLSAIMSLRIVVKVFIIVSGRSAGVFPMGDNGVQRVRNERCRCVECMRMWWSSAKIWLGSDWGLKSREDL